MTMTYGGLKDQLDGAFDEADDAQRDVQTRTEQLQKAQKRADETKGLSAAARRQLKNAEAKYRVLLERKLAETDTSARTELEAKARSAHAKLDRARFYQARQNWLQAAKEATANLGEAVRLVAEEEGKASTPARRNELKKKADQLHARQNAIAAELGKLETQAQLPASGGGTGGPPTAGELKSLEAAAAKADQDLANASRKPGAGYAAVSQTELDQAEADVVDAKRAVLEAPEVQRGAQAELRLARERLEEAQERLRIALAERDKAEELVIEDIDLAGPGTDGDVTATARLRQDVPYGYKLNWTVNGTPAGSDQKVIRFNATDLPVGRFTVELSLDRAA